MRTPLPSGRYRWRAIAWTAAGVVVTVAMVLLVLGVLLDRDLVAALRDPTFDPIQSREMPIESGWLSYAGALVWWSAAAASLFAATAAGEGRALLLSGGLLSAGLCLDDLFMIHDLLVPSYLGLPEVVVLVIWATLVATWVLRFRRTAAVREYMPLLWLAGLLFATSIGIDIVFDGNETATAYVAEDAAKLLGTGLWAAFHIFVARRLLVSGPASTSRTARTAAR